MENTKQDVIRHKRRRESPPSASNLAICTPLVKQVLLHDWWLIKADSDILGKRLGIGGFTSKGRQGIRTISSGPIVKRNDAVTLRTVDGLTVLVHGLLNWSRTLGNGFSHEVCEHFRIGFPYYWEEFSAMHDNDSEEPTQSSSSDSHEASSGEGNGTNMPSGDIFDEIPMKNHDDDCVMEVNTPTTKSMDSTTPELKIGGNDVADACTTEGNTPTTKSMDSTIPGLKIGGNDVGAVGRSGPLTRSRGPLTRSRARLL